MTVEKRKKISKEYINSLLEEYTPNPEELDDETLELYERINNLDVPDRLILYLYSDMKSERDLATALGTSRTTVRRILSQIREKIGKR